MLGTRRSALGGAGLRGDGGAGVGLEGGVPGHDGEPVGLGLGDQEAVEGVAVAPRQRLDCDRVADQDRELLEPVFLEDLVRS